MWADQRKSASSKTKGTGAGSNGESKMEEAAEVESQSVVDLTAEESATKSPAQGAGHDAGLDTRAP